MTAALVLAVILTGPAPVPPIDCAALWAEYEATGDSTRVDSESCYSEDLHD